MQQGSVSLSFGSMESLPSTTLIFRQQPLPLCQTSETRLFLLLDFFSSAASDGDSIELFFEVIRTIWCHTLTLDMPLLVEYYCHERIIGDNRSILVGLFWLTVRSEILDDFNSPGVLDDSVAVVQRGRFFGSYSGS